MTIDEMIAVLQAAKEGKKIQHTQMRGRWWDCDPAWNFADFDYRVKPEPLEFWAPVFRKNKDGGEWVGSIHDSREGAEFAANGNPALLRIAKFQEVDP